MSVPESAIVDATRVASTAAPSPPPSDPATHAPTATPLAPQVGSSAPDFPYELDFAFDEDLTAFSTIEREDPSLVAKLTRTWGTPEVIANLRDILASPRVGTKALSPDSVSELMLLQSIAMETGSPAYDDPWHIELNKSEPSQP